MIVLASPPSWSDIPDSTWAVDQPVYASKVTQLAHNAKFAMVRREFFTGLFTNGQTVTAPVSRIDGYPYSYAEVTFWWHRQQSWSVAAGRQTGSGCILQWNDSVNPSTGLVSMATDYYIDGGAEDATNDGQLMVWMLCQRAMPALGAIPAWNDVPDSELAGNSAAIYSVLAQMNVNVRFGCVRHEFFTQTLYNGDYVALPTSPVDGYTYARRQLRYLPSMTAPWKYGGPGTGAAGDRSGPGTVRQYGATVDPMSGLLTAFTTWYQVNGVQTDSTDGRVLVLVVGDRGL